jgi:hypothetical protein
MFSRFMFFPLYIGGKTLPVSAGYDWVGFGNDMDVVFLLEGVI